MGKYSVPEWIGAMRARGTIGSEFALEQSLIHGNHATIIEAGPELAAQGNMLYKIGLRQTMEQCASLDVNLNSSCLEIGDHEVLCHARRVWEHAHPPCRPRGGLHRPAVALRPCAFLLRHRARHDDDRRLREAPKDSRGDL